MRNCHFRCLFRRPYLGQLPALALALSLASACSDTAGGTPPQSAVDSTDSTDSADSAASDASDTAAADTAPSDSAAADTDATAPSDSADAADTAQTKVFAAVAGARCAPAERIGLVSIYAQSGSAGALDASAVVNDIADPRLAKTAKLSDAACSFFEQLAIAPCGPCPAGKMCGPSGVCTAMPVAVAGVKLLLRSDSQEQSFEAKDASGAYGTVTLAGKTFGVELQWGGLSVTLGDTSVPPELPGLTGKLNGGYDKPSALDLTWTPPADAATLFTHIPINHHAGAQTFTECAVPASAGTLHVDGPMLLPLSVSTGLEFQGIEHVRFAAAQTPLGCVELRFQTFQYVDLNY